MARRHLLPHLRRHSARRTAGRVAAALRPCCGRGVRARARRVRRPLEGHRRRGRRDTAGRDAGRPPTARRGDGSRALGARGAAQLGARRRVPHVAGARPLVRPVAPAAAVRGAAAVRSRARARGDPGCRRTGHRESRARGRGDARPGRCRRPPRHRRATRAFGRRGHATDRFCDRRRARCRAARGERRPRAVPGVARGIRRWAGSRRHRRPRRVHLVPPARGARDARPRRARARRDAGLPAQRRRRGGDGHDVPRRARGAARGIRRGGVGRRGGRRNRGAGVLRIGRPAQPARLAPALPVRADARLPRAHRVPRRQRRPHEHPSRHDDATSYVPEPSSTCRTSMPRTPAIRGSASSTRERTASSSRCRGRSRMRCAGTSSTPSPTRASPTTTRSSCSPPGCSPMPRTRRRPCTTSCACAPFASSST